MAKKQRAAERRTEQWAEHRRQHEEEERRQRVMVITEFDAGDPETTMHAMATEILEYRRVLRLLAKAIGLADAGAPFGVIGPGPDWRPRRTLRCPTSRQTTPTERRCDDGRAALGARRGRGAARGSCRSHRALISAGLKLLAGVSDRPSIRMECPILTRQAAAGALNRFDLTGARSIRLRHPTSRRPRRRLQASSHRSSTGYRGPKPCLSCRHQ